MGLITLLTDYNYRDFYLAKVESRIKKHFLGHDILHISHGVSNFEPTQTAYNYNALLEDFSSDTWHFIFINIHYEENYKILVAQTKEHGTIVTPDNGVLGLLNVELESVYQLPITPSSFAELNIIEACKTKEQLFQGLDKVDSPTLFKPTISTITEKEIKGEVIYVDSYGNCITNIIEQEFNDFVEGKSYHIKLRRERIERISIDYSQSRQAGIALFFNHQKHLEISNAHGNSSKLLGLQVGSRISVKLN